MGRNSKAAIAAGNAASWERARQYASDHGVSVTQARSELKKRKLRSGNASGRSAPSAAVPTPVRGSQAITFSDLIAVIPPASISCTDRSLRIAVAFVQSCGGTENALKLIHLACELFSAHHQLVSGGLDNMEPVV